MQETDGIAPPSAHSRASGSDELGNDTVYEVVLRLLARCAKELVDADRWLEDAKLATRPLVAAVLSRKLMSGQAIAELLSTSEASVSGMKKSRPSQLDDLALESALRDVAVRWRTASDARDLARALRWRWVTIGDWVGLTDRAMASAAGLDHGSVNKLLNRTPRDKADEYLRVIAEGLGQGSPRAEQDMDAFVERLMVVHAADTYSDDPDVLFAAGWYFKQLGDPGALAVAARFYEQAAADGGACAAHNLALVWESRGDLVQAEQWFIEADNRGHTCSSTAYHGHFLIGQGRVAEGVAVWAAAANRGVAAASRSLAEHLHRHDEHEEEAVWWERAAVLGDSAGLRARGWRYWRQGDLQGAERAYLEAATRGDAESACWVGRQMMVRGPTAAQALLEQASQAGVAEATEALICLLHARDPRRALSACQELARQGGTPPRVHYALLLEQADGSSEALAEAYRQWLAEIEATDDPEVSPSSPKHWKPELAMAYSNAGRLARRLGEESDASRLLWRALESTDAAVINCALTELAELDCSPDQDQDEALRDVAEEAIALGYHQVALPLADVLEERDAVQEAVELLRLARRHVPKHSELAAELEAAQLIAALPSGPRDAIYMETFRRLRRCARDGSRRAFMFLGSHYMTSMTDEPRDALGCFQWLVEHGEPYHRELAEAMMLCDDPRAAEVLDEGIADGEIDCYALRGILEEQQGRLENALEVWTDGARAGDWESGVFAGQALQRAGRIQEARARLKRTAERGSSCAWSALGTLEYEERGRVASLKHFRRAMENGCLHGAYNLAAALLASKAPTATSRSQALSALRFVLQADPSNLSAAQLLASLTAQEGAPELPAVLYASAIEDHRSSQLVAELDAAHHPDRRIRSRRRRLRFWRRRSRARPQDRP
jgi:tetratricopeptide (TPR) repeat protein